MKRQIVLLRGVNLASRNRVAMPELRSALHEAGFPDVATYLQSGNAVVSSAESPESVARRVREVIATRFGLDIAVVVRSREEMAAVIRLNPLGAVAADPRRYLVTFLSRALTKTTLAQLSGLVSEERFATAGLEIYSWHPDGVTATPLWNRLASRSLGVEATSRNWTTVTRLLAMADETGR